MQDEETLHQLCAFVAALLQRLDEHVVAGERLVSVSMEDRNESLYDPEKSSLCTSSVSSHSLSEERSGKKH
ncbi:hypothetical protein KTH_63550 [Thermosporothrix hazakensis]|nr:hypothetical protein KTH_63550 [Thermosporothrix hazakensis]